MMRGNMEKKLGLKSYIGYGVADLGNNIAFAAVGSYLTVFYSDVLGAKFDEATAATWLTAVTAIMIIARIWDAINDPIMGWLAQRAKPSKYGKFRQYLLIGGIPLALSAVLMFAPIPDMSLAECIVFAFFTYIAYGMLYTVVLVPYGSLATVMTRNQNERSRLSIARSIGGGIGGVPAGILFPLLVYSTAYNAAGEEIKLLDGNKLVICMAVIAVIMLASYTIAFFFTKENFEYPPAAQQTKLTVALKSLVRNKPFVIMSLAGMLLIASSMYINSIDVYLFNVYYQKEGMMTFVTIATYAPMVVMIPFTEQVIKKVGKKEICVYGLILSVVATLVMTAWHDPGPVDIHRVLLPARGGRELLHAGDLGARDGRHRLLTSSRRADARRRSATPRSPSCARSDRPSPPSRPRCSALVGYVAQQGLRRTERGDGGRHLSARHRGAPHHVRAHARAHAPLSSRQKEGRRDARETRRAPRRARRCVGQRGRGDRVGECRGRDLGRGRSRLRGRDLLRAARRGRG